MKYRSLGFKRNLSGFKRRCLNSGLTGPWVHCLYKHLKRNLYLYTIGTLLLVADCYRALRQVSYKQAKFA